MYILLEGIDGVGKSTQLELIRDRFPHIITTREPAGTELGVKIRDILLNGKSISKEAETLLFLADRAEHYNSIIAQNRDKHIVSDRGFISGVAYSLTNGDCDINTLKLLNSFALQGNFPDFIFLFWIDKENLYKRLNSRNLDNIELRGVEYLLKVQENMLFTIEKFRINYQIIDATESIDDIFIEISKKLKD